MAKVGRPAKKSAAEEACIAVFENSPEYFEREDLINKEYMREPPDTPKQKVYRACWDAGKALAGKA